MTNEPRLRDLKRFTLQAILLSIAKSLFRAPKNAWFVKFNIFCIECFPELKLESSIFFLYTTPYFELGSALIQNEPYEDSCEYVFNLGKQAWKFSTFKREPSFSIFFKNIKEQKILKKGQNQKMNLKVDKIKRRQKYISRLHIFWIFFWENRKNIQKNI